MHIALGTQHQILVVGCQNRECQRIFLRIAAQIRTAARNRLDNNKLVVLLVLLLAFRPPQLNVLAIHLNPKEPLMRLAAPRMRKLPQLRARLDEIIKLSLPLLGILLRKHPRAIHRILDLFAPLLGRSTLALHLLKPIAQHIHILALVRDLVRQLRRLLIQPVQLSLLLPHLFLSQRLLLRRLLKQLAVALNLLLERRNVIRNFLKLRNTLLRKLPTQLEILRQCIQRPLELAALALALLQLCSQPANIRVERLPLLKPRMALPIRFLAQRSNFLLRPSKRRRSLCAAVLRPQLQRLELFNSLLEPFILGHKPALLRPQLRIVAPQRLDLSKKTCNPRLKPRDLVRQRLGALADNRRRRAEVRHIGHHRTLVGMHRHLHMVEQLGQIQMLLRKVERKLKIAHRIRVADLRKINHIGARILDQIAHRLAVFPVIVKVCDLFVLPAEQRANRLVHPLKQPVLGRHHLFAFLLRRQVAVQLVLGNQRPQQRQRDLHIRIAHLLGLNIVENHPVATQQLHPKHHIVELLNVRLGRAMVLARILPAQRLGKTHKTHPVRQITVQILGRVRHKIHIHPARERSALRGLACGLARRGFCAVAQPMMTKRTAAFDRQHFFGAQAKKRRKTKFVFGITIGSIRI
eukprot:comp21151_c0_seq1/m.44839 comp21151_c0_seq1/g.44839  ORF comp21151_c0_seq1/g.44839 comp21151_c0_seq1/m.44839 type:complete len:635 (-) comp21151_c0_seq1:298-2202(-)